MTPPPAPLPLPSYTRVEELLLKRQRPDGGFSETPGGDARTDASAWATMCLVTFRTHPAIVTSARSYLAAHQTPNGSIPLSSDYPEAYWTTALAAQALDEDRRFATAHDKAIAFLLATSGRQLPKEPGSPIGHDSMIPGWAWIEQTHSWVEPTALAISTLVKSGRTDHPRVRAGIDLLLDRQLPQGGWNYGNTTVFGKTLGAMPTSTGIAVWALAGLVDGKQIAGSLEWLRQRLVNLRTPLSLGWALRSLAAWQIAVPDATALAEECLQRQERYGAYSTSHLCALLMGAAAMHSRGG